MKRYRNWIIALFISATAGAVALQSGLAPSSADITGSPSITSTATIAVTDTPTTTPTDEPCSYTWAYQDAPELTAKIESALRELNPEVTIRVQAFGENCVHSDGSAMFLAKETDLYIRTSVITLTDEEAFGNWMAQVLPIIVKIPENEFPGGYGFVEFRFEKNDSESIFIKVQIQSYFNTEVQTKSGVELFRLFYNKP